MRDLNEDSNGCSWPVFYGDKALSNGHYQNGLLPRTAEAYLGYDRDIVRQTMIEHETIFRSQVYELHRLYRIQRDLMDEIKRKELHIIRMPVETSLASSPLVSQITCEGARKWHIPNSPLVSSNHARPSISNTERVHSPVSSMKGDSTQAAAVPSPNGSSFKTSEVLESRPSKVRRKMIDLRLPADEYIDSDEQEQAKDETRFGEFMKFRNQEYGKVENGVNLFPGRDRMGEYNMRSREVADLNQPIPVEETSPSHSDVQDPATKPKSLLLGLPHENYRGHLGETLNNLHVRDEKQGRAWLPHVLEAGDSKGKQPISQGVWPEKYTFLQPNQGPANSACVQVDESKLGHRVERSICDLGISESFKSPESVLVSQLPSQYQIAPKTWSQSFSSWEKPGTNSGQKPMPVQMHPCADTASAYNRTSHQASQSYGIFADKWHERIVTPNPAFGNGLPYRNGFYSGSSSGSKEVSSRFSPMGYEYLKCHNDGSVASEDFEKFEREVNLNVVPKIASPKEINEESKQDSFMSLPWLRPKTSAGQNEVVVRRDHSSDWFASKTESGNNLIQRLSQDVKSVSSSLNAENERGESGKCPSDRRIFGCPVSGKPVVDLPSVSVPHLSEGAVGSERRIRLLDINLPCDLIPDVTREDLVETPAVVKESTSKAASCRHEIDLNSCLSDDETFLVPSVPSAERKVKPIIDLEIPAVPESEEDVFMGGVLEQQYETSVQSSEKKTEHPPEDFVKGAAEAIVAISLAAHDDSLDYAAYSLPETSEDPLNWFADTVLTCITDREGRSKAICNESASEEVDYFELMSLKLTDTKPEDYMPEPFIPETIDVDEPAAPTAVSSRPRRGQARRGRQRRDFQRDILPGLASLSRHEVTEDIQTFTGMMRATGYSWQSGLTRRNSSRNGHTRGRRRATASPSTTAVATVASSCTPLTQQLNSIEVAGLEDRSLTSWGKTTRRPRRQRCPAGNPALLHLT